MIWFEKHLIFFEEANRDAFRKNTNKKKKKEK